MSQTSKILEGRCGSFRLSDKTSELHIKNVEYLSSEDVIAIIRAACTRSHVIKFIRYDDVDTYCLFQADNGEIIRIPLVFLENLLLS